MTSTETAALGAPDSSTFTPIAALEQQNADLSIVFLINDVQYLGRVDDPWFRAQVPLPETDHSVSLEYYNSVQYKTALPANPLACASQVQWCNPAHADGSRCTELTGAAIGGPEAAMASAINELDLNPRQTAVLKRLYQHQWNTDIYSIADEINFYTLLADEALTGTESAALPNDQWVREVDHWFGLSLTAIQLQTVNYALGDGNPSHDKYVVQVDGESEWMCSNQLVPRDDFSSFSVLGLILIFVLGSILILTDLFLSEIVTFWYTRISPSKLYKLHAWRASSILQVQSQAFESQGLGTWDRSNKVPTTTEPEHFINPFSRDIGDGISRIKHKNHWWRPQSFTNGVHPYENVNGDASGDFSLTAETSKLDSMEVQLKNLSSSTTSHLRPSYERLQTDQDTIR